MQSSRCCAEPFLQALEIQPNPALRIDFLLQRREELKGSGIWENLTADGRRYTRMPESFKQKAAKNAKQTLFALLSERVFELSKIAQ